MSVSYRFEIRQTDRAKVGDLTGVITHIHFNYLGEDDTGKRAVCEGVVPFQVTELVFNGAEGDQVVPSELDAATFIPEDAITEEVLISWLEQKVPAALLEKFRRYISERIAQMES
jgi:hypothetical protein